jgi:hypothetical protein
MGPSPIRNDRGAGRGRATSSASIGGARFVLPASIFTILLGSCSLLVEPDRQQCTVDADCRTSEVAYSDAVCIDSVCEQNPTWSCLGGVSWPPPEPRPATVIFQLRDLIKDEPAVGVTARLCRKLDFDCMQPLASGMRGDNEGTLTVEVGSGFDGYVELTSPDRLPGIYFFYPPVSGDRVIPNVPLIRQAELQQFATLAGRPVVYGRGHVMLGAYNCRQEPADGVRLSSEDADANTTPFYLVKRVPSATATATDSSGRGGMINLRAGSISISGVTGDGRPIGSVGLFVRAGTITYTSLLPAPR